MVCDSVKLIRVTVLMSCMGLFNIFNDLGDLEMLSFRGVLSFRGAKFPPSLPARPA